MPLKPIPGRESLVIKKEFKERYSELLQEKYPDFMEHSTSFIRRSIRVNTLKITVKELRRRLSQDWQLEQIPWCREGFWITGSRLDIGNLPEHILGYIYVQESASMIPPLALSPRPHQTVLDMCAAPGSKTTQMAAMMANKGAIIANDINADRIKALGLNLNRAGVANTVITHMEGRNMRIQTFDKILLDAPCSATGTIRRNLHVLQQYNYALVKRLAAMQKGLIKKAYSLLNQGGTLVYSTCSMEPEENEGAVDHLLKNEEGAKLQKISLAVKSSETIAQFDGDEYDKNIGKCLRIWPQDNDTEGFFIAKIMKS
ncbi:RsmB/NOP family class I SAM-dependent RNA methyltransferase [Candidatus Woesearchaeota archaeon]|nr:RsmB/NOP family class I SAM-dependent RNA methyltransferase [Candidatus Woesearchaeota archaeon]